MSKKRKIWLIVAAALILSGGIIFSGVMTVQNWDFSKLSTYKSVTNLYEIEEQFTDISIDTDTAEIIFVPSKSLTPSVECFEKEKSTHSVNVIGNTLEIKLSDTRKWYEHIGINFSTPKITVYIPAGEYGSLLINSATGSVNIPEPFTFENMVLTLSTGSVHSLAKTKDTVKISTTTGNINLENMSAKNVTLSASTGKITADDITCSGNISITTTTGYTRLSGTTCDSISSTGTTGNVELISVVAKDKIEIKRSTGNIDFEKCDAAELTLKATTGRINGSLLSDKTFIADSATGNINVPQETKTIADICTATTSTGNIYITVE